jgi:hypothetical protein
MDKLTKANRSLDQLDKDVNRAKAALKGLAVAFGVAAAAGAGLAILAKKLLTLGAAASETRNKFREMFGDMTDSMNAFVADYNRISGLTKQQAEDILANAAMLAQGFGYSERAAADLAKQIIQLGGDFASFLNLDTARAAEAIRKALTGERESMKLLNVQLTEQDVLARALIETGKTHVDQITKIDKAQASLALITEAAGKAIGDQARTADSNTNVMRQLSAAWVDLKTKVGSFLDEAPFVNRFLQDIRNLARDMVVVLDGNAAEIKAMFEGLGAMAGGAFVGSFLMAIDRLERFVIGSFLYNLFGEKLGSRGAYNEAQKSFEAAGAGLDLVRHTARGMRGPTPITPPVGLGGGGTGGGGVGGGVGGGGLLPITPWRGFKPGTRLPGQAKFGDVIDLSDVATPIRSFASMLDGMRPTMIDFDAKAGEASDKLKGLAIAGMHAASSLGLMIKQGGSTGGILGGILGTAGAVVGVANPLAGAAMMAGGALLGGLSAPSNKPVPVSVERYGASALAQQRETDEPVNMAIVYETGGKEIKRIQRTLRRAQLRDGVVRLAS